MQSNKKFICLFLLLFVIAIAAMLPTLRGQGQRKAAPRKENDETQIPVADYSAPEPTNAEERAKRQAKGNRFNKRHGEVREDSSVMIITESNSWLERLPALPIAQSDVVVIGEVSNAQAYLSSDNTGVYSEFTIRTDEILMDRNNPSLSSGAILVAEREGGKVRFPSGHVQLYTSSGLGTPSVGKQYVIFLKRNKDGQDYLLLTGYELREGQVISLDDVSRHTAYETSTEQTFLNAVRKAIANSSQTPSEERR